MVKPLLTLLVLSLPIPAVAGPKADFFVGSDGNDAWSGRFPTPNPDKTDGPFATPAKARDAVRALRAREKLDRPVRVLVRDGRYELAEPLTFTPADSGTKESPTMFEAIPGHPVVLSGGTWINRRPLRADGEDFARYPLPRQFPDGPVRLISVNGEARYRPRLPKEGFYTIAGLAGADPKGKYDTKANKFEFKPGEIDPNWKNLTDVEAVVLHFWVDTHLKVQSVDAGKRIVTFDRFSSRKLTDDYQNRLARYYLTNVFEALGPGEFYRDGALLYKPKPGEDLRTAEVVVPRLDAVVKFEGKPEEGKFVEWVELRGLKVRDAAWDSPAKDAVDAQAASIVPGAVRFRGARHCAFTDGMVKNVGGYGIEIGDGCRSIRVVGNEVTHTGAGGIKLSGGNANAPPALRTGECVITDNHLHHLGEVFHSGVGVLLMHADKNLIAHNHIHHLYYTGISVGWVWGYGPSASKENRIEFNHIHDVGQKMLSDMGGIYTLGVSPGTMVRGNHIHDVDSWSYGGWGIYTDEGSTGITIENNLVYRTKSGGFHQHYGKENVVRNNIFALAREGQLIRSREEDHTSFTIERNVVYWRDGPLFGSTWKNDRFVIDRNVYWNAAGQPVAFPGGDLEQWRKRGHDVRSVIADPKFRDPDKGDFSFADESVVKRVGFVPFDVSRAGPRPKEKRD
ncbi:MAG TPA: right-handed parallel beta-helix repeat-containing protein [Gemmataceae bacterium]|nr:right-handed parallel beta-helix repeat-containing protein [Gemmataceae bacterium]